MSAYGWSVVYWEWEKFWAEILYRFCTLLDDSRYVHIIIIIAIIAIIANCLDEDGDIFEASL